MRCQMGSERPVSFASRTLTPAKKNYSQLDREAFAVVFTTKKFHLFLYGKRFTLYTDHKPLLGIFRPSRGVPEITSPRRPHWILTMATYEFDLKHRPGGLNGNADGLSRLPLPTNYKGRPSSARGNCVFVRTCQFVGHGCGPHSPADSTRSGALSSPPLCATRRLARQGFAGGTETLLCKAEWTELRTRMCALGCSPGSANHLQS